MRHTARSAAAAVLLACALVASAPLAAWADEGLAIELSAPEALELSRIGIVELPIASTPGSIEVGIDCGMEEMCGIDPCLCGAVDDFGACACNGTEQVDVSYTVELADEGVARVVEWNGALYVVALSAGETEATVTASLVHYEDATAAVTVRVTAWTALDVVKVAGALVVLACAVALAVGVVVGIVHGVRRIAWAVRARRAARGARAVGATSAAEAATADAPAPALTPSPADGSAPPVSNDGGDAS